MHPLVQRFYNETKWKDKCLLLELIHIKLSLANKNRKWRIRDTARALKLSVGLVSEDLRLARAISNETIDSKIESRNKAIRLIRREKNEKRKSS
jgi:hypothetical protein